MGGGGLYGTAGDYIKFTQMILNKGKGNGNQVLKPETVALMGQNHIGDLVQTRMISAVAFATNDVDLFPGMVKKWGLSFLINTATTPEGRSPGGLFWAGLANTYFWIDPARDVTGVILMQVLPFCDGNCLEAFAGFERGVYAGLDATAEGGVKAIGRRTSQTTPPLPPRSGGEHPKAVIPGRAPARTRNLDSGFDASHRPGMTDEGFHVHRGGFEKRVDDGKPADGAAVLQVFAVKRVATGFDGRGNDQRIKERQAVFAGEGQGDGVSVGGDRHDVFERGAE